MGGFFSIVLAVSRVTVSFLAKDEFWGSLIGKLLRKKKERTDSDESDDSSKKKKNKMMQMLGKKYSKELSFLNVKAKRMINNINNKESIDQEDIDNIIAEA